MSAVHLAVGALLIKGQRTRYGVVFVAMQTAFLRIFRSFIEQ